MNEPKAVVAADNDIQGGILRDIVAERRAQDARWTYNPRRSDELMLTLLVEEIGECARAMQPNDDAGDLDRELTQSAALIVQWLEHRRRRRSSAGVREVEERLLAGGGGGS